MINSTDQRDLQADQRDLERQVQDWIEDEVDPTAAADLTRLLDQARHGDESARADLLDRFAAPLSFGTAGLRGPVRAGPRGMNRAVVRRTAAGICSWLIGGANGGGHGGGVVVIGYDARYGSTDFAIDSAAVFAAAGFQARLLPGALPTPVLAFAVQALGARLGVMVTASHNPREDNGYKVYGADGAQIVSPTDRQIEAAIRAVGPTRLIPLGPDATILGEDIVTGYVRAVAALVGPPAGPLSIVHTALHGVGTRVLRQVFTAAGYPVPLSVPEQAEPDPRFPTLPFPNPEEPGALDLALALARDTDADLVIASDPDADRCAVAVDFPGTGWRMLRGDELGWLLADALLHKGITGTYATTIVSSSLLQAMAARHGVAYAETLTGFKWITRAAPDLAFGYEEALGYAIAPQLVRDKDGISAALLAAQIAASLKACGSSLPDRLEELAGEYGRHVTDQISVRVDDVAIIADTMRSLRADPPTRLLGQPVQTDDLLPATDGLRFWWRLDQTHGGRVVVRPSGTEPKLKAYLEVVTDESAEAAQGMMTALRHELDPRLRAPGAV